MKNSNTSDETTSGNNVSENLEEKPVSEIKSGETSAEASGEKIPERSDALEKVLKENAELKDSWSRERAEFVNYKKRVAQDNIRFKANIISDFVGSMLVVIDHLENVMKTKSESEEVKNYVKGVEMIHSEFYALLNKNGIRPVSMEDGGFNPEFMEAISSEKKADLKKETVLEVFQDGFYLEFEDGQKKIIRPARVRVGMPE